MISAWLSFLASEGLNAKSCGLLDESISSEGVSMSPITIETSEWVGAISLSITGAAMLDCMVAKNGEQSDSIPISFFILKPRTEKVLCYINIVLSGAVPAPSNQDHDQIFKKIGCRL